MATATKPTSEEPHVREYLAHEQVTLRSIAAVLLEGDPKQRVDVRRIVEVDPSQTPRVVSDRCFIEVSVDAYQALLTAEAQSRVS
ncbi:MAG: hypothetical protein AAF170_08470 [Bacteroidota bacterium]